MRRSVFIALLASLLSGAASAQERKDERRPVVGMLGRLYDVVLPGSELEAAPVTSTAPIVLRVTAVQPHGDAFRYDLEFYGLEAGKHDLTRYLRRADGSPTALPPLEVEVISVLLPGQELPLDLAPPGAIPVGRYRIWMTILGVAWLVGLIAMVTAGRGRAAQAEAAAGGITTRARLASLLADAQRAELSTERQAEVERLVIDAWRGRLDLRGLPPQDALARMRADASAGPALAKLEAWLHLPPGRRTALPSAELAALAPDGSAS